MTIQQWVPIFKVFPQANFVILDSLSYLTEKEIVRVFAFVIMHDHVHLLWQYLPHTNEHIDLAISRVQHAFRRYTATRFRKLLLRTDVEYLEQFISNREDRMHKFWKIVRINQLMQGSDMLMTKIKYIHNNPTKEERPEKVRVCEDFYFSSALSYARQQANYSFLTLLSLDSRWY